MVHPPAALDEKRRPAGDDAPLDESYVLRPYLAASDSASWNGALWASSEAYSSGSLGEDVILEDGAAILEDGAAEDDVAAPAAPASFLEEGSEVTPAAGAMDGSQRRTIAGRR